MKKSSNVYNNGGWESWVHKWSLISSQNRAKKSEQSSVSLHVVSRTHSLTATTCQSAHSIYRWERKNKSTFNLQVGRIKNCISLLSADMCNVKTIARECLVCSKKKKIWAARLSKLPRDTPASDARVCARFENAIYTLLMHVRERESSSTLVVCFSLPFGVSAFSFNEKIYSRAEPNNNRAREKEQWKWRKIVVEKTRSFEGKLKEQKNT